MVYMRDHIHVVLYIVLFISPTARLLILVRFCFQCKFWHVSCRLHLASGILQHLYWRDVDNKDVLRQNKRLSQFEFTKSFNLSMLFLKSFEIFWYEQSMLVIGVIQIMIKCPHFGPNIHEWFKTSLGLTCRFKFTRTDREFESWARRYCRNVTWLAGTCRFLSGCRTFFHR